MKSHEASYRRSPKRQPTKSHSEKDKQHAKAFLETAGFWEMLQDTARNSKRMIMPTKYKRLSQKPKKQFFLRRRLRRPALRRGSRRAAAPDAPAVPLNLRPLGPRLEIQPLKSFRTCTDTRRPHRAPQASSKSRTLVGTCSRLMGTSNGLRSGFEGILNWILLLRTYVGPHPSFYMLNSMGSWALLGPRRALTD